MPKNQKIANNICCYVRQNVGGLRSSYVFCHFAERQSSGHKNPRFAPGKTGVMVKWTAL